MKSDSKKIYDLHIDVDSDSGAQLRLSMVCPGNNEHVVLCLLIIQTRGEGEDAGRRIEREHFVPPLGEQAVGDVRVLILVSIGGSHLPHLTADRNNCQKAFLDLRLQHTWVPFAADS